MSPNSSTTRVYLHVHNNLDLDSFHIRNRANGGLCLAVLFPRKLAVLRFEAAGSSFLQVQARGCMHARRCTARTLRACMHAASWYACCCAACMPLHWDAHSRNSHTVRMNHWAACMHYSLAAGVPQYCICARVPCPALSTAPKCYFS